jgi:iron complex outermembrane receptor protein
MRKILFVLPWMMILWSQWPAAAGTATEDLLDMPLEELMNQKVSTASRYEQTVGSAPSAVTIVTAEDIEHFGYRTMEDVLRRVPGFYVSNDRNYSYAGVRGFGRPTDWNNRILLLINGHRMNENFSGITSTGTELGGVDLRMADRIEIVRGPGSALYGASAMFAVINIIMKDGGEIDGGRAAVRAGSYDKYGASLGLGKELNDEFGLFLSGQIEDVKGPDLFFSEYDDPGTNNGIAVGLDWDEYYGVLGGAKLGGFTLQGFISSREKGVPTAAYDTDFNGDSHRTLDEHAFVDLKYDRDIGAATKIMLRGYYDHYRYGGAYPYDGADWLDMNDCDWAGAEFQYLWDIRSNNRLVAGVEYQNHFNVYYKSWDEWDVYFDNNYPFRVLSLYAQDEWQIASDLSLMAGIRHDDYSYRDVSNQFDFTSPRAAVMYSPIQTGTIKLLYGRAFRAPTVNEMFYEDEDEEHKANPGLQPEEIETYELVWEQQFTHRVFGVVSVYNNDIEGLIDFEIDPADSLFQFQDQGRVQARGVEMELQGRIANGFGGYASYAYQWARDAETDKRLTNSPDHLVKAGLSYPFSRHFYGALESQYETGRLTVYGTETDPHLVTHLKATVNFPVSSSSAFGRVLSRTSLSIQLRNLFDEDYKTPGGYEHIQDAIQQNGRTFLVELDMGF